MQHGTRKHGPLVGLAALVLGVLIAQVAVAGGGSSADSEELASLKRQVAKLQDQIGAGTAGKKKRKRGPRGPAGPQGIQGLTGLQGPPGPTAAGVSDRVDPLVPTDLINPTPPAQVATPATGRIFAFGRVTATIDCSTAAPPQIGLYLGPSTGVPDSVVEIPDNVPTSIATFGLTGALPPATHSIGWGLNCPTGDIVTQTLVSDRLGGIFIGQ